MKIILFADKLPPKNIGGMETHGYYFIEFFKNNSELIVISKDDLFDVVIDNNREVVKRINLLEYLKPYSNEKVVIFYNSGMWIEQMMLIRKLLPNAIITYRTGGNEIIKSPLSFFMPSYEDRKKIWCNIINNSVDYLITNSTYTDYRLKEFGIKEDLLIQIGGGVNIGLIDSARGQIDINKKRFGLENKKVVVSCSRFVPYKRTDELIKSLAYCKNKITLLLAGDGPMEQELQKLAKLMPYEIQFMGKLSQEDSVKLISCADVYAQASCDLIRKVEGGSYVHTEGMGRSLLEAMCLGIPVVVTNCGAVGEYVNNDNGALVDTPKDIASKVDYFIDNKIDDNMDEYCKRYSFDSIFRKYESLWK